MTITSLVMSTDDSGDASLRLPVIAPKEDVYAFWSGNSPSRLYVPARVRLPPRSKTGCWTCRSRKVKCDEARPTCGQCARLGHQCDYSPRLSFRDDTQRIMERMPDVSTVGSVVWDPSSKSRARRTSSNTNDELPPFASLTSDEERERKAESSDPGTYHVIVNPDSFSSLPEYADEGAAEGPSGSHPSSRRNSANSSMLRNTGQHDREGSIETDDPNVVILSRFEDTIYKSPATQPRKPQPSPASNLTSPASPSVPLPLPVDEDNRPLSQVTVHGSQEDKLLSHFRNVVWKQLNHGQPTKQFTSPLSSPMLPNVDVFQEVASMFRPLFHAIMAISALSLAHRDAGLSVDSLQHYQQAFPSLQECIRSDRDLCSDGVFLTHFLLLVYEVAAAQPSASNLWSQHISRLLQISLMRSTSFAIERYPYINWWICCIDLYGLLSGAGTGEFLAAMLKNDLVPSPECKLYPLAPRGCSVIYPEETESLPAVLQLHHETFLYAAHLAFLAASLRGRSSHALSDDLLNMGSFSHSMSSEKLYRIQIGFQQLWESPRAAYLRQRVDSFPPRPRELFLNALTMYHACMIYSFTSMWPGQALTSGNVADEVIERHVSAILQVAEDIVQSRRFDLRFIIFPLLMAGYATARESVKRRAIELMMTMENDCVGRNATATRRILELVSEKQAQQVMAGGRMLSVDWMEVMAENGLQVVDFGM